MLQVSVSRVLGGQTGESIIDDIFKLLQFNTIRNLKRIFVHDCIIDK